MKIIKSGIELLVAIALAFIIITVFLSAIVGCVWLWKNFIIGGLHI